RARARCAPGTLAYNEISKPGGSLTCCSAGFCAQPRAGASPRTIAAASSRRIIGSVAAAPVARRARFVAGDELEDGRRAVLHLGDAALDRRGDLARLGDALAVAAHCL